MGGTLAYMAPEHLRAMAARDPALAGQVDHRSDIYSLGMVLYEMVVGHKPFDESASNPPMPALLEAMAVERAKVVPSVREHRPDVAWGMEYILRKCLHPDPQERYQQADHLAEDLRALLADRPLRHASGLSIVERLRQWARRHPRLTTGGIVGAVAGTLLSVLVPVSRWHGPDGAPVARTQQSNAPRRGTARPEALPRHRPARWPHSRLPNTAREQPVMRQRERYNDGAR